MSALSISSATSAGWIPLANNSPTISALSQPNYTAIALDPLYSKIADLMTPGEDIPAANARAAEIASTWLPRIFDRASNLGGWRQPHITSTEAGEVLFEWWNGDRKLSLYFSEVGDPEFIEVWGADIENEMESGDLTNWSFAQAWLELKF